MFFHRLSYIYYLHNRFIKGRVPRQYKITYKFTLHFYILDYQYSSRPSNSDISTLFRNNTETLDTENAFSAERLLDERRACKSRFLAIHWQTKVSVLSFIGCRLKLFGLEIFAFPVQKKFPPRGDQTQWKNWVPKKRTQCKTRQRRRGNQKGESQGNETPHHTFEKGKPKIRSALLCAGTC